MKKIFTLSILFVWVNLSAQESQITINSYRKVSIFSTDNLSEFVSSGGVVFTHSMSNNKEVQGTGGVVFTHSMGNRIGALSGGVVIAHSMGNLYIISDNESGEVFESLPTFINLQIGDHVYFEKL